MNAPPIPQAFVWRRLHSLMGLWLVIYLIDHLLINSQAALFFGDDGRGFISSVNSIHNLPYLPIIEILVLGVPIGIHAIWGIKYLFTAKMNSYKTDGSEPSLPEYPRNRAYSWQRITSWFLVVGILAHVIHMRFVEYPSYEIRGSEQFYSVRVSEDPGLAALGERLGFELKTEDNGKPLNEGEIVAVAKDFGTAELLIVRNAFKSPVIMVLYTLFVIAACYHAFNGLWTCLITWGVILTETSQKMMLKFSHGLMIVVTFLGLAAIWATYWINLKN